MSDRKSFADSSKNEQIRLVRDAWYAEFTTNAPSNDNESYWVSEVYDDRVIVEHEAEYFSYSYSVDENDAITFGEPEQVRREISYTPIKRAIKLLHESPEHFLVGGYGHIWGSPEHPDLYGEYFTPDTDLMPSLVPVKLVLFEHALDKAPDGKSFDHPIGRSYEDQSFTDQVGKWITAQLDKRAEYVDAVMALIDRGVTAWSSGSVPHLIKRASDGWLERWPVVEYTGTLTPAEPRNTNIDRLKAAYKAAGLELLIDGLEPRAAQGPQSEGGDGNRLGAGVAEGPQSEGDLATALAIERERLRLFRLMQ